MPRANANHASIPSRKNMPRNIKPRVSRVNADNDTISNLSQLVGLELQYLEETFEAAKLAMDRVLLQMKEASAKFDDLIIIQRGGGGGGGGTDTDSLLLLLHQLQELKIKVSNMKSKIPFNLILLSKSEQLTSNPHFNWIPRNPQHRPRLESPPLPTHHRIPRFKHYQKIRAEDEVSLCCLVVFPENAIIKKSLLHGFLKACEFQSLNDAEDPLKRWVKHGLIKPVYKKCNLIVAGYWIHPLARSLLRDKLVVHSDPILFPKETTRHPDSYIYVADNIEEDTIYSDPIQFRHPDRLRVLHLGKWKKSSTCHIEVADPDILANYVSNLDRLKYLSLGGISMIEELPRCITNLRHLKTLDLKACHNIEAIPSEIANLRWSLTRLDMSECYFLEHMPMALAQLHQLEVLKGFFVGQTNKEETCTLQDLVPLRKLKKLNIYTNNRGFPDEIEQSALREFEALRNLTISWGGCSTSSAIHGSRSAVDRPQGGSFSCIVKDSVDRYERFGFKLEKLDLQCIPSTIMYDWLKPGNFKTLKRLYIRGGQLHDLGQPQQDKKRKGSILAEEDQWHVEMLRLKYLNKLTVGWHDLHILFPRLIFLEKIECPNLTSLRTDDNGVWMNTTQLRERLRNRIKV